MRSGGGGGAERRGGDIIVPGSNLKGSRIFCNLVVV